jgi:hypothetical protein
MCYKAYEVPEFETESNMFSHRRFVRLYCQVIITDCRKLKKYDVELDSSEINSVGSLVTIGKFVKIWGGVPLKFVFLIF